MREDRVFRGVPPRVEPPRLEMEVLDLWKREGTFARYRKEMLTRSRRFVFLEGPPTANGLPHIGHALTRSVKDLCLRYMAMSGYGIYPYIGGWDCHGLPVEIQVEKELGLRSKTDIERFGVEGFNRRCRESVFRYEREWREMSERIGFWLDFDHPYITMENDYIESVWWSLKCLWERGLLEKDYNVVPYCPRCGTPLSSHEVAQGYREITEPAVYVKFRLKGRRNEYVLAWTTTPWTLPGNVALAVGPGMTYVKVAQGDEVYHLAKERLSVLRGDYTILDEMSGSSMAGLEYEPLYRAMPESALEGRRAWFVAPAEFVTTDEGTGVVHTAVMYGEDDYALGRSLSLPRHHTVDTDGRFTADVDQWAGAFVKDAEPGIVEDLRSRGLLYAVEEFTHSYPFCWRCDTPLLYYALESWFIRTSRLRKEIIANNESVTWRPDHLKHGRFGNFLEELKDWALSRNRFWGTPLPIWMCGGCGEGLCVGGVEELASAESGYVPGMDLHRPHIDAVRFKCGKCGAPMEREPYVIDCWYDSGSAFFAQFHYPFEGGDAFRMGFPVDFITEAIDQTRGWFYTTLVVSSMVFDRAPYRTVLCLGHILDEKGRKMSTSRGNMVEVNDIVSRYGADVLRYTLYSTPVWESKRFSEKGVRETLKGPYATLWNVYSFFVNYANIDGYRGASCEPADIMDRWILSRLCGTISDVNDAMKGHAIHRAVRAISGFVEDLSLRYLRSSRRRFWEERNTRSKRSAYSTLYRVLVALSRLLAPFMPFLSESMHQNLYRRVHPGSVSVHLEPYPGCDVRQRDERLESMMRSAFRVIETVRRLRQEMGIKVRYPLREVVIIDPEGDLADATALIREEINVKRVRLVKESERPSGTHYVSGETGDGRMVFLNVKVTPALRREGLVRDIVRRIQIMRKEMDLEYTQRIIVSIAGDPETLEAVRRFAGYIMRETLCDALDLEGACGLQFKRWDIDGRRVDIAVSKS